MLTDRVDKTLTTTATTAVNYIDEHHKTAVAHVDSDKHPSTAASVETAAIKSSEQVAKAATEQHNKVTARVAATSDNKEVKKDAVKSSEQVAKKAVEDHHNLTAQVTKTATDKDVAKAAKDSSKSLTSHSADSHATAHGELNWNLILLFLLLIAALVVYFYVYVI
tara:strand:- start:1007 stop:1501 length:495 start_codon:yes stop_codon:yes gene_type:complete